ncbi:hypothetical protein P2E05_12205 [Providencia stuartii]|uniref:hypothetical protein n=1 Tax=Providencia TaxID=586 RepID=UPI0023E1EC0C|nr:hypothetical protein [Providencia stuartii]ELR5143365.1 hypothetical protein [Providencia stuartii]WER20870.1 hypothetical protein P2E04_12200 [Providencia stuartii]WER24990.1 hypothetical protein P2E05_12205 [Providencia stuartii]WER29080.1 hypothetical protein P2E06_12205 [Providencia stuartii]
MKKIMITALLALFLSGCDNSPPAPYGFKWGQSMEEVKALNLEGVSECSGITCVLSDTPDNTKGKTVIIFDHELGLVQVVHSEELEKVNKNIVLDRFSSVESKLALVYGEPVSKIIRIDNEYDFFACLDKLGCSTIKSEYEKEGYKASVSIGTRKIDNKLAILTDFTKPIK